MLKSLFQCVVGDIMARDANRLIHEMGESAFAAAGDMAWKEDAGLLVARRPGHWNRVQLEIGRRTGRSLAEMDLRIGLGGIRDSAAA